MVEEKKRDLAQASERQKDKKAALVSCRDIFFLDELQKVLTESFRSFAPSSRYKKTKKPAKRILSAIISDTHFGSWIDPEEVNHRYGPEEESRAFGKVVQEIAEYKTQYRDQTTLKLNIIGDIIQNQLHDAREGAPLASQFASATFYLSQAVTYLAQHFPQVDVHCAVGNHGRNVWRHRDRAVQQKWDSIESMIYYSASVATSGLKNVKWLLNKKPYYTVELFDKTAFFTHGDTVLKPGYPGNAINVKGLYQQICKWNAARNVGGPFSLFGVGHVHFGSMTHMPGGITMLTNGCLVPPDAYAVSIGSPDVTCGQWLFESVESYPVGDTRFINVDDAKDHPEFNQIIQPYRGPF
jgi:hypothetical protein